jgi:hypothetical protein
MARTMLKTKQPPKLTLGKKTPAASRAPRKSARGGGSQRFVVSHPNEADFKLKGWIRSEFEGQGAHTMHAGACWIQPPRIEHKVLGYSDDCEVLEIILPAEFETVMLD